MSIHQYPKFVPSNLLIIDIFTSSSTISFLLKPQPASWYQLFSTIREKNKDGFNYTCNKVYVVRQRVYIYKVVENFLSDDNQKPPAQYKGKTKYINEP